MRDEGFSCGHKRQAWDPSFGDVCRRCSAERRALLDMTVVREDGSLDVLTTEDGPMPDFEPGGLTDEELEARIAEEREEEE